MDWTTTTLAERIRHLCTVRGLTQNALGELAGIGSGPIAKLCRAKRPSADSLAAIADAAGADLRWLHSGRGAPPNGTPQYAPPRAPEAAERAPSRTQAIELVGALVDPAVVAALRAEPVEHEDPGFDHWKRRILELAADRRALRLALERVEGASEPPPATETIRQARRRKP